MAFEQPTSIESLETQLAEARTRSDTLMQKILVSGSPVWTGIYIKEARLVEKRIERFRKEINRERKRLNRLEASATKTEE